MSLADWEWHGWLVPHTTSPQEIVDLLALVQRDLHDSRARDVSADWRFNIAYNPQSHLGESESDRRP